MPSRRVRRLNEHLKREISDIIRRGVRDPRVGVVTVTDVDVTSDLYLARVYVRLTGSDEQQTRTLEGLRQAAPFVRRELAQGLSTRRTPELEFEADRTLERAMRIEAILADVRPEKGWEAEEGGDEERAAEGEVPDVDEPGEPEAGPEDGA